MVKDLDTGLIDFPTLFRGWRSISAGNLVRTPLSSGTARMKVFAGVKRSTRISWTITKAIVNSSGREIEIKLAAPDVRTAQKWLRAGGFRVYKRRVFESNIVFDLPDGALRGQARLLRVRQAGNAFDPHLQRTAGSRSAQEPRRIGDWVDDPVAIRAILDRLGYRPVFTYEKYRTEYRQPGQQRVSPRLTRRPSALTSNWKAVQHGSTGLQESLDFRKHDYILDSYGRLYLRWGEKRGVNLGIWYLHSVTVNHHVDAASPQLST